MSESQSRYSIVERMIRSKMDIMTAKTNLKDDIIQEKQDLESNKKEFAQWEKDIQTTLQQERNKKQREIDNIVAKIATLEIRLTVKEQLYDAKIKEIDKAIAIIEEISKTTPTS